MPENLHGREFLVRNLDANPPAPAVISGWQPKDVAGIWAARHLSPGEEARLEIESLQSGRVWTCNARRFTTTSTWGLEEAA